MRLGTALESRLAASLVVTVPCGFVTGFVQQRAGGEGIRASCIARCVLPVGALLWCPPQAS